MADLWDDLLTCLELVALPDDAGYEGKNLHLAYHRLFGGQLIGQFIAAAALTCSDKSVKSLHVLFPREGHADEPVRYTVDRHHEGGTFATLGSLDHRLPDSRGPRHALAGQDVEGMFGLFISPDRNGLSHTARVRQVVLLSQTGDGP